MFGNAVQAKLASMVLIGAGSFVVGIAPACFVSRARHLQRKLLLSCALCFGAGVLLATAMLHVLPETRHGLPDYAELVFSCGFLVLYLVEECVHYFCRGDDHGHSAAESRLSRLTDSRTARERGWVRAEGNSDVFQEYTLVSSRPLRSRIGKIYDTTVQCHVTM